MSKCTMPENIHATLAEGRRHGGLLVSAIDSGASDLGSSPGQGHYVMFLGKRLYSHSPANLMLEAL